MYAYIVPMLLLILCICIYTYVLYTCICAVHVYVYGWLRTPRAKCLYYGLQSMFSMVSFSRCAHGVYIRCKNLNMLLSITSSRDYQVHCNFHHMQGCSCCKTRQN